MYRRGHKGMWLLIYAPVLAVFLWYWSESLVAVGLALVGLVLGLVLVMLPDRDQSIPLLPHRGITHTIWFALLVGLVMALVGMTLGPVLLWIGGDVGLVVLFFAFIGVLSILSHLIGDAITHAGIRPYQPLSNRRHSGRISANSFFGNWMLWILGIGAILFAVYFVLV